MLTSPANTTMSLDARQADVVDDEVEYDDDDTSAYFTYRPLSNLPTPPPTYREDNVLVGNSSIVDGEPVKAKLRGPAIHLVNLIPSSASLTPASVPLVQAMLSRADLPIETVALAVCILDSLDKKFARAWRQSCPLHQTRHIDSVPPEVIILAALVIAVKFTEDPLHVAQHYRDVWGRGTWSLDQLNATERCIMESLNYRIMPLCHEDCLADAMTDMQLAGTQPSWPARKMGRERELSPPDSVTTTGETEGDCPFAHGRDRSETASTRRSASSIAGGLGLALTPPLASPAIVEASYF